MSLDTPPATAGRVRRLQLAREHLERIGLRVLATDASTRWGTLDLVACDPRTLVFCEVEETPGAGAAWDLRRRRQIRRLAAAWLAETADRPTGRDVRFDHLHVRLDDGGRLMRLDHVEAAY